ncbi:MAG TPA: hypothetical protein VIL46_13545 [Gemmataceae bacterium]
MEVYPLWHVHEFEDGREDEKLLGIYSSRELAEEALERARSLPGFRDAPDGFEIGCYTVDRVCWPEGYVTELPGEPMPTVENSLLWRARESSTTG